MSTRKGVWDLQQVRDKYLQSLWVNSNQLFAWGQNAYGDLAQNDRTRRSSPTQIPGTTWADINPYGKATVYGEHWSITTKTDGTLWAWGLNNRGQLGQNSEVNYSSPVQVGSDTTWDYVDGGGGQVLAIKTDGTGWVWGRNYSGQLGLNQSSPSDGYSSPVQLPGTWSKFKASKYESFGIKTDGTLWAWGYNNQGILGQNNRTAYSSPTQIPGTTWVDIDGSFHMIASKTDGTLWSWGYGGYGEIGQNNKTYYSSPVQIPGTSWTTASVYGNYAISMAMKTDGTLWVWGGNGAGQLGQNDRTQYSSPVQVPGTDWSNKGALGYNRTFAIKTNGELWSWGYNAPGGQLGHNDIINYSSPVQIPGTWNSVLASHTHTYAIKKLLAD